MKHTSVKDIFVIGFALFSMFFGAGNVIFPPYLGLESGSQWFFGFLCYFIADIGLALLALFAIMRCGSTEAIVKRIGKIPSVLLMTAIVLCIGPMLAIPRTAASTFEMSVQLMIPDFSAPLFSVVFFAVIFLLSIRESAVVDIVGKILTPLLLLGLLTMILSGIINPIGPIPSEPLIDNVAETGIKAGYQTLDALASMIFGIILLNSAENKGYTRFKDKARVITGAGIVAGIALFAVYLGLTYLGVSISEFADLSIDRTTLLISIVQRLLGSGGVLLFSVVTALACITTAIALVSASSEYFSSLSGGRLSYKALCVIICVFSAVVSNIGLEEIITIASPILDIVYPPALVLIVLAFFSKYIQNDWIFRMSALGALIVSLFTVLNQYTEISVPVLNALPLSFMGFGWVLPAAIGGILGALIPHKKNSSKIQSSGE